MVTLLLRILTSFQLLRAPESWSKHFEAEIVETTFVVSRFSDIQKETTLFLVEPQKNDQERCSFSVGTDNT